MPKYKYIGAYPQSVTGKGGVPIHLEQDDIVEYVNYAPPTGVEFELYTGSKLPKHVFEKRVPVWERVVPHRVTTVASPVPVSTPEPTMASPMKEVPPVVSEELTVEVTTVPSAPSKVSPPVKEPEVLLPEPETTDEEVVAETKETEEADTEESEVKETKIESEEEPKKMWKKYQLASMRKNEMVALAKRYEIKINSKLHRDALAKKLHEELVKLDLAE